MKVNRQFFIGIAVGIMYGILIGADLCSMAGVDYALQATQEQD